MRIRPTSIALSTVLGSFVLMASGCCGPCKPRPSAGPAMMLPAAMAQSPSPCPTSSTQAVTVTKLEPDYVTAGSPEFRLTVAGTGFTANSVVCWNGTKRPTRYYSATLLKAHLGDADLATPTTATVAVAEGSSVSNGLSFPVIGPTTAADVTAADGRKLAAGPLTVGALIGLLNGAIDSLAEKLKNLTNDLISVGHQLQASAHAVVDHLMEQLGDKLERTEDLLQGLERQLFQDASKLVYQLNAAAEQLSSSTAERALITMYEADILAYNTTQNLPCQAKVGRLVYAKSLNPRQPLSLRLGFDANELIVLGNWLDLGERPQVSLAGKRCHYPGDAGADPTQHCMVKGYSAEQLVIGFPDRFIADPTNPQGESVEVRATTQLCKPRALLRGKLSSNGERSAFIRVVPRKQYTVYTRIWATAKVRSQAIWNWQQPFYYREENCDGYARHDRTYRLPNSVDYELAENPFAQLTITSGPNCNSGVDGVRREGNSAVKVEAHVGGCGTSWLVNCNGRGWLGYVLNMRYFTWPMTSLQPLEYFEANVTTPYQKQFDYTVPLPSPVRYLSWHYYVRVVVTQGGQTQTVELSEDDELAEGFGITTSQNESTGAVTVNIPQTVQVASN